MKRVGLGVLLAAILIIPFLQISSPSKKHPPDIVISSMWRKMMWYLHGRSAYTR